MGSRTYIIQHTQELEADKTTQIKHATAAALSDSLPLQFEMCSQLI